MIVRAACVQLNAGTELGPNLEAAADGIRRARDAGATLIATPECTGFIAMGRAAVLARARTEAEHPGLPLFAGLARETGATLLIGSLAIAVGDGLVANRSFLFGPDGAILARYDKIHMFDVDLAGGESYRESASFRAGGEGLVAELPDGARLGMTICYDLRFPQLHRALAKEGAEILSVPAAFTWKTGSAHWHVLLRARAIEAGAFVIAPAQTGTHDQGRRTWGHSLIVDPWGTVLADAGEPANAVVTADLDLDRVAEARAAIPALRHDRPFTVRTVPLRTAAAAS
jgi:predicted amidohydrolase